MSMNDLIIPADVLEQLPGVANVRDGWHREVA